MLVPISAAALDERPARRRCAGPRSSPRCGDAAHAPVFNAPGPPLTWDRQTDDGWLENYEYSRDDRPRSKLPSVILPAAALLHAVL